MLLEESHPAEIRIDAVIITQLIIGLLSTYLMKPAPGAKKRSIIISDSIIDNCQKHKFKKKQLLA